MLPRALTLLLLLLGFAAGKQRKVTDCPATGPKEKTMAGSKTAVTVLQEVNAHHVKIDEQQRKETVKIVEMFVKVELISRLKKLSPMFGILYREIGHTGSFYDGLRVADAKEFDLNLVFNLPVPDAFLTVEDKKADQGFVRVGITKEMSVVLQQTHPLAQREPEFTRTFLERDSNTGVNYLIVDKMRRWMEGLLTKALDMPGDLAQFGIKGVTLRKSGPALTLLVDTLENGLVEIDLVPAFALKLSTLSNHPRIDSALKSMTGFYYVIPKKSTKEVKNGDRQWRMSFPEQEKTMISQPGLKCVKVVIKLLKTFRDKNQPLDGLSSYSLKTVVMQMMKNKKYLELWPSDKNLADLFILALETLHGYLVKGHIPHIYDAQSNLLWNMNSDTIENKRNWLARQIRDLKASKDQPNCREVWLKYFQDSPK